MSGQGYWFWDVQMLRGGVYLNGEIIHRGAMVPLTRSGDSPARTLTTLAGTQVLQRIGIGGDAPLNLRPLTFSARFSCDSEADYFRLVGAADSGTRVYLMPHLWIEDRWYIPGANPGQTTWRTSRRLAHHLPGYSYDFASRQPQVLVDDVPQTVLSSGTPGAGEVVVPDTGGYVEVVTPAGLSGSYLALRYAPELVATLEVRWQNEQGNLLICEFSVIDHLLNTYTGALPS